MYGGGAQIVKDSISLLAQRIQARRFHVGLRQGPGEKACPRVPAEEAANGREWGQRWLGGACEAVGGFGRDLKCFKAVLH